jgi:hypothetical protein
MTGTSSSRRQFFHKAIQGLGQAPQRATKIEALAIKQYISAFDR